VKPKKEEEQKCEEPQYSPYFKEFADYGKEYKGKQPIHKYTVEIHRAMYTEEVFDVYYRYELAIHKKERTPDNLNRFLCNNPLYDPEC